MLQFPINRTAFVCKIGKTCLQLTTRLISENNAKGMPDKIYLKALLKKKKKWNVYQIVVVLKIFI